MTGQPYQTWQCRTCGYIYEGLAPGTRWADVPAGWVCPLCGTKKSDFDMVEF